jgi:hypothetical protein
MKYGFQSLRAVTFDISPVGAVGKRAGIPHPAAFQGSDFEQKTRSVKSSGLKSGRRTF